MRSLEQRRATRGFTMVELLVVIGIVVVLLAILLPTLAGARRRAQEVRCAGNLRALGYALTHYARESGYYPGGYVNAPKWAAVWPARLRPVLGSSYREVFLCPARDAEEFGWPAEPHPVVGGAVDWMVGYGYALGEPMVMWDKSFSYGYNALGTGGGTERPQLGLGADISPSAAVQGVGEVRASRIKSASAMIAVADSEGDGYADPLIYGTLDSVAPPGAIHRGGANFLFCDGRVQWYERTAITVLPNPDGTTSLTDARWRPVIVLWRNDHNYTRPGQP